MGLSDGFTFQKVGGWGRLRGSWPVAAVILAWTSREAASIWRLRSNWMVIWVWPWTEFEVIWATPWIWANWRSSGWATAVAMVSGLAPGKLALTLMVGNSTRGRGETGRSGKAATPTSTIAAMMSEVPMGRLMNGAEMFMGGMPGVRGGETQRPLGVARLSRRGGGRRRPGQVWAR